MKIIKACIVAAMALFLTLTTLDNLSMPDVGLGAVEAAVKMETTFKHPGAMWRAITERPPAMAIFGAILIVEAVAAAICWVGAARMWLGRADAAAFRQAKAIANLGLSLAALLYFGGFLVVGAEWFLMWQSQPLSGALEMAFRMFTSAMVIMLYVSLVDDA